MENVVAVHAKTAIHRCSWAGFDCFSCEPGNPWNRLDGQKYQSTMIMAFFQWLLRLVDTGRVVYAPHIGYFFCLQTWVDVINNNHVRITRIRSHTYKHRLMLYCLCKNKKGLDGLRFCWADNVWTKFAKRRKRIFSRNITACVQTYIVDCHS